MEDSKDSIRPRIECPRCGEDAHLLWILNKNHGLCSSCWKYGPLKESSQVYSGIIIQPHNHALQTLNPINLQRAKSRPRTNHHAALQVLTGVTRRIQVEGQEEIIDIYNLMKRQGFLLSSFMFSVPYYCVSYNWAKTNGFCY